MTIEMLGDILGSTIIFAVPIEVLRAFESYGNNKKN